MPPSPGAPLFDAIWSRFLDAPTTLGPTPGVREAWHRGRPRYAVWVLRVDDAAVLDRRASMADLLAPHGALPFTDPHITLFVVGFPTPAPLLDDDVADALLDAQVAALVAADLRAPRLLVGGLNAFLSCPILEVRDPDDALAAIRTPLGAEDLRFAPYVPHLTVGTFGDTRATGPVAAAIAPLRGLPSLPLRPSAVELVTFDASALGPLHTRARVALRA